MRLKLGPDLSEYAGRFDVPPATGPLGVTFLGVASLLLDDGETALMTDGFFSRPSLAKVALGKLAPDLDRIDDVLARAGVDRLAAVLPGRSWSSTPAERARCCRGVPGTSRGRSPDGARTSARSASP